MVRWGCDASLWNNALAARRKRRVWERYSSEETVVTEIWSPKPGPATYLDSAHNP